VSARTRRKVQGNYKEQQKADRPRLYWLTVNGQMSPGQVRRAMTGGLYRVAEGGYVERVQAGGAK
jgi:hypothetical protein